MRTAPNDDNRRPQDHVVHTVVPRPKETEQVTEKVAYTKVKKQEEKVYDGPIGNLDCQTNFAFEKERVKAIEHTEFFVSVNTTNLTAETQLKTLKQAKKNLQERDEQMQQFDKIAACLKIFAIVITLVCAITMIATFFGVLLLSLSNVPIEDFITWLSAEAVATILFMYISVKISGLNRNTLQLYHRQFKLCLIFCIGLIVALVVVQQTKPMDQTYQCMLRSKQGSLEADQRKKSQVCIILFAFFLSCVYKLGVTLAYITIWIILQLKFSKFADTSQDSDSEKPSTEDQSSIMALQQAPSPQNRV